MAWTDPAGHVWTTGEVVTAASLNTYVRLNLEALYNAPACRAYNSAAISAPTGAWTYLTFNSERFDNDGIHSTTTNTGRLTCITAGLYLITGSGSFVGNATGARGWSFLLNGTTTVFNDFRNATAGGFNSAGGIAATWKLIVGDYLQFGMYQNSGGALNVEAAPAYSAEFAMVRLSAG